ncbi:MAG: SLC13 family permease [Candidatus Korarchaeota archaeon]
MLPNPAIVLGLMFLLLVLYLLTNMGDEVSVALFIGSLAILYLIAYGFKISLTYSPDADIILIEWVEPAVMLFLLLRMIMIESVKGTGLFDYITLKLLKLTGDNPLKLWIAIAILTHFLAILTGQVTAILIVGTIIVVMGKVLNLNIAPFLVGAALVSTISTGGLLTTDVTNIVLAFTFNISFVEYATIFFPVTFTIVLAYTFLIRREFRDEMIPKEKINVVVLKTIDPWIAVENKRDFYIGANIIIFSTIGYFIADPLLVSLIFAILSLILLKREPQKIFLKLQWDVLFIVASLILLTNAMNYVGTTVFIKELIEVVAATGMFPYIIGIIMSIVSLVMDNTAAFLLIRNALFDVLKKNRALLVSTLICAHIGNYTGNIFIPVFSPELLLARNMVKENQPQNMFSNKRYYKLIMKIYPLTFAIIYCWVSFYLLF